MTSVFTPTPTNETSAVEFDDGDAPSAGNLNPLGEAAFNTAKWAANRIGVERVVARIAEEETGLTALASTTLDAYQVPPNASVYSMARIEFDHAEGDVVELSGFVYLSPMVAGTDIYVRPGIMSQPDAEFVYGAEIVVKDAQVATVIPIFARLVVPVVTTLWWVIPFLAVKSGTAGREVAIVSPSSVVARVWRATELA